MRASRLQPIAVLLPVRWSSFMLCVSFPADKCERTNKTGRLDQGSSVQQQTVNLSVILDSFGSSKQDNKISASHWCPYLLKFCLELSGDHRKDKMIFCRKRSLLFLPPLGQKDMFYGHFDLTFYLICSRLILALRLLYEVWTFLLLVPPTLSA